MCLWPRSISSLAARVSPFRAFADCTSIIAASFVIFQSLTVNFALDFFRQAIAYDAADRHVCLHLLWAPLGVARLALLELAVLRRLAVADLVRAEARRVFGCFCCLLMIFFPSRGVGGARRRGGQLVERLAGLGMDRCLAGQRLPAADGGVDVVRVELDGAAHAAGLLRRQQGRAAADERDRALSHRASSSPSGRPPPAATASPSGARAARPCGRA